MGRLVWVMAAGGAALGALASFDLWGRALWLPLVLLVVGVLTPLALGSQRARVRLSAALAVLRARPLIFWLLILVYVSAALTVWVLRFQPSRGRWLEAPEIALMLFALWALMFVVGYGWSVDGLRAAGGRIAASPFSGVLVLLTTAAVLFWGAEGALRLFYITPDGYGLTAMSYLWYFNYYDGRFNSLGYRDYEPQPDTPTLTRIAVVGDSFAAGHGIDQIEQVFPHQLEQRLGAGVDVNALARPGYDMQQYTAALASYPYQPDIVVLSYYLNEVDPLLEAAGRSPNRNFAIPSGTLAHGLLRNFCTLSAVYYLALQLSNTERTQQFARDLFGSYFDDAIWTAHTAQIDTFIEEVARRDAALVVLVWPSLVAVEQSTPAVERVSAYFAAAGASVVSFAALVDGQESPEWVINRFDFHPSVLANEIAAAGLAETVRGLMAANAL